MYNGLDKRSVRYLTSSVGNIYINYGYGPVEKTLVLACSILTCSEFFLGKEDKFF